MKKVEKPKKPLIFYYLIALIILVLLNTFLFPNILGKNKVKEVDYGTFLTMVEGKEVSKVELNGDTIILQIIARNRNIMRQQRLMIQTR